MVGTPLKAEWLRNTFFFLQTANKDDNIVVDEIFNAIRIKTHKNSIASIQCLRRTTCSNQ